MTSKSDELRSRLPRLAAELDEGIRVAIDQIQAARKFDGHATDDDVGRAWQKGVDDALRLLRPARDAHERFKAWIWEVLAQEVDQCGLTAEEREQLVGPVRST